MSASVDLTAPLSLSLASGSEAAGATDSPVAVAVGTLEGETRQQVEHNDPSPSSPLHATKRRKVDVDLSFDVDRSEAEESDPPHQQHPPTGTHSPIIIESEDTHTQNGHGRPQRKAKSEANQRVAAMANSLLDNTEVPASSASGRRRSNGANRNHTTTQTTRNNKNNQSNHAASASSSSSSKKRHRDSHVDVDEVDLVDLDGDDAEMEEADVELIDDDEPYDQSDEAQNTNNAQVNGKRAGSTLTETMQHRKHSGRKSVTKQQSSSSAAAAVASSSPPAVASSSSSSSSSQPPKKVRDLRRDKRASGFAPWKVVHKSAIAAMTFEGYEDLARQILEPQTQEEIKASQTYSPQGTDSYHHDPTDILTGKAEMPLTLMRRIDTKYGREEYKVQAARTIERKEVVTFLGGRLMEQVKANKQMREEWNQHFHMKKEWLRDFFEYKGQHDLVVSTKDHRCIASYIRGPEERTDGEVGANLKADVVLEPRSGLFYVIYYATERIRRGQEVFCMPFLGDWHDRCHREMFLHSRISHWYHKYALRLERRLLELNLKFDEGVPPNMRPVILTADQEEKFLAVPGMDQGALPEPLPMEETMVVIDVQTAMECTGCKYSAKAIQKNLSAATQHYIDAVGEFIPHYLELRTELEGEEDEDGNPVYGNRRYYVDRQEVLQLIEDGYRKDCLELREELGIHSPVRHFTPPNYRSFCVVATQFIPKGTFVFVYAGVITEEVENRDSAYVYMMESSEIRRTVKSYHGPDLQLDALKVGNISRFVNDNCFPAEDHQLFTEHGFMFLEEVQTYLREHGSLGIGCSVKNRMEFHKITMKDLLVKEGDYTHIEMEEEESGISLAPTDNHRMWLHLTSGDENKKEEAHDSNDPAIPSTLSSSSPVESFEIMTAREMLDRSAMNPHESHGQFTCRMDGLEADGQTLPCIEPLNLDSDDAIDAFVEIYGCWLASGTLDDDGAIIIPATTMDIESLLTRLGLPLLRSSSPDSVASYTIQHVAWIEFFRTKYPSHPTGVVTPCHLFSWCFRSLGARRLRLLIQSMNRTQHQTTTMTTNEESGVLRISSLRLRDELQRIMIAAGYSAHFTHDDSSRAVWSLHYTDEERTSMPTLRIRDTCKPVRRTGTIWCVSVPTSEQLIVFRRVCARDPTTGSILSASRPLIVGNTYRVGESESKGSTSNLETQFLFVKGTIHLGFYTTRDVQPKEELVSQYGEDYWKTINKQLIDEHKRFFDYINPYTRKLEQLLYRHGHSLPSPPPDDWCQPEEEKFCEKPLPYPKLRSPDDKLVNEDGTHQVERILQMRKDPSGAIFYFVKVKQQQ